MFFTNELIWDEKIENRQEIIDGITQGKAPLGIYLITLNAKGTFEIFSCYQALKEINHPNSMTVIGIAKGKNSAFEITGELYNNWYQQHHNFLGLKMYYK